MERTCFFRDRETTQDERSGVPATSIVAERSDASVQNEIGPSITSTTPATSRMARADWVVAAPLGLHVHAGDVPLHVADIEPTVIVSNDHLLAA